MRVSLRVSVCVCACVYVCRCVFCLFRALLWAWCSVVVLSRVRARVQRRGRRGG